LCQPRPQPSDTPSAKSRKFSRTLQPAGGRTRLISMNRGHLIAVLLSALLLLLCALPAAA
jgi:hypothetical protein